MADEEGLARRRSRGLAHQPADGQGSQRPNMRLELAGAAKQGTIPFVRQLSSVERASLRCARGLSARSSSAIR